MPSLKMRAPYQIPEEAPVELRVLGGERDVPQPLLQGGLEDDAGEGVLRLAREFFGSVDWVLHSLEGRESAPEFMPL